MVHLEILRPDETMKASKDAPDIRTNYARRYSTECGNDKNMTPKKFTRLIVSRLETFSGLLGHRDEYWNISYQPLSE